MVGWVPCIYIIYKAGTRTFTSPVKTGWQRDPNSFCHSAVPKFSSLLEPSSFSKSSRGSLQHMTDRKSCLSSLPLPETSQGVFIGSSFICMASLGVLLSHNHSSCFCSRSHNTLCNVWTQVLSEIPQTCKTSLQFLIKLQRRLESGVHRMGFTMWKMEKTTGRQILLFVTGCSPIFLGPAWPHHLGMTLTKDSVFESRTPKRGHISGFQKRHPWWPFISYAKQCRSSVSI